MIVFENNKMYSYTGGSRPDLYEDFSAGDGYKNEESRPIPSLKTEIPVSHLASKILTYYKNTVFMSLDINPFATTVFLSIIIFTAISSLCLISDVLRFVYWIIFGSFARKSIFDFSLEHFRL